MNIFLCTQTNIRNTNTHPAGTILEYKQCSHSLLPTCVLQSGSNIYSFLVYVKYLPSLWEMLINFLETQCCVCPESNSLLCIFAAMVPPDWLGHMICRPLRAHYLTNATLHCNNIEIIYRTLKHISHFLFWCLVI